MKNRSEESRQYAYLLNVFFLTASDGSLLFSKKFELFDFRGEPS